METREETMIMQCLRGLSFSSDNDCVAVNGYGNGVALAYISKEYSAIFPTDGTQVGKILDAEYENITFFNAFFVMSEGVFTGDILGSLGAIPGLEHRQHKEELLYAVETIAKSLPRKGFDSTESRPICFVRPHEDLDALLVSNGYTKQGTRRWKEL